TGPHDLVATENDLDLVLWPPIDVHALAVRLVEPARAFDGVRLLQDPVEFGPDRVFVDARGGVEDDHRFTNLRGDGLEKPVDRSRRLHRLQRLPMLDGLTGLSIEQPELHA